jgi:hypothetical protein
MIRKALIKAALLGDPKLTRAVAWKISLKAARIYADQWCREYVKGKWQRCVTCGSPSNLEWAHILSGKGDAVRWDIQNMTRQCTRCNQLHESHPEHLHNWFITKYGYPDFAALVARGNVAVKRTYSQIMKIGSQYRDLANGGGE